MFLIISRSVTDFFHQADTHKYVLHTSTNVSIISLLLSRKIEAVSESL